MQKPKQQIILDNYQAQYNSIRENIAVVNKELESALEKRNNFLKEFQNKESELLEISKKISNFQLFIKDKSTEITNKENNLLKRQTILDNNEIAFYNNKDRQEKILNEKIKNSEGVIAVLNSKIQELEENLKEQKIQEKNNKEILNNLNKDIKTQTKELNKITDDIKLTIKIKLSEISHLDKDIETKKNELKNILDRILFEQNSIVKPREALALQEKELLRKKKNLDTLIKRFNKRFQEHYPLVNLNI